MIRAVPGRFVAVLSVLVLILVGGASAQSSVRVEAEARPMEVETEGDVTFTLRVRGVPPTVVQRPSPPSTTKLSLQGSAPRTQRTFSGDGGGSITFKWKFRALEVGTGRLGPVKVTIRGETFSTEPIPIRVRPRSQGSSSSRASPVSSSTDASQRPPALFIRALPAAQRAYQNEQIPVEYRLFFRPGIRLRNSRLADAWDAPGFWREELNVASHPTPQTRRVRGQVYETIALKRVALFPTKTGSLHVDPLRIQTEVQGLRRGSRGTIVPGGFEAMQLASEPLTLTVQALPAPAPQPFEGAVGRYSLDVGVDTDSATVGEPVHLRARLRGTGNLATLSAPHVPSLPEFEVYEPAVQTEIDRAGERIRGSKTFTFTLVPRSSGDHDLPSVQFAFFDPNDGRYETLQSEPPTLHVTGEAAPRAESRTGQGLPVGDIAGLADDPEWVRTDSRPLYRQPWAYGVVLLPFLLALGGLAYRRRRPSTSDEQVPDAVDENDTAERHLNRAEHHLKTGAGVAFHETVERALYTFLRRRLRGSETNGTRAALERCLARQDVPEADREALGELLDACEQAQFTPAQPTRESMRSIHSRAQSLLARLDRNLPSRN